MRRLVIGFVGLVAISCNCLVFGDEMNIAQGKAVSLNGTFFSGGTGVDASTLVDDVFLARGTQWQTGTVWWVGATGPQSITIDLNGIFKISSFVVQADDNDAYRLLYLDGSDNTWKTAWDVPNFDALGWGMQTRPNPEDNLERFTLANPITTSALKFMAVSGDNLYSVSEIQAFGAAVPSPSALVALTGMGVVGLIAIARRRRNHVS